MKFVCRATADVLGGRAVRKLVSVLLAGTEDGPQMDLLVYLPRTGAARRPSF